MEISKYPKTEYDSIKIRYGLEGVEPLFLLHDWEENFQSHSKLVIQINTTYPSEIIAGGSYLNPRILKLIDESFSDLNIQLVTCGTYPDGDIDTPSRILPLTKVEWVESHRIYTIIDGNGIKLGEFRFLVMDYYAGDFYFEDVAIFIALSKEQNSLLLNNIIEKCKEQDVKVARWPDIERPVIKPKLWFIRKFFNR